MSELTDSLGTGEDAVAAFQIDGKPIRGRALRLGDALDKALRGHAYHPAVASLLGEAILVSALMARALKFKGRLLVQAHGTNEGAISMIVADCSTDGNIRAYARYNQDALDRILSEHTRPGASTLLGCGTFAMTIDQGPDMENYQGLAAIEGDTLGECAEHYFRQSEQIPTRVKLAIGQLQTPGKDPVWRGAGIMVQQIAGDKARGDTSEAWETTKALFGTLTDAEMLDPDLGTPDLLYRLFHEDGVRVLDFEPVQAKCKCSRERLLETLSNFPASERDTMFEDGEIKASCDFCASIYVFTPSDFESA